MTTYQPTTPWVIELKKLWIAQGIMPDDNDPVWQARLAEPAKYLNPDIQAEVRAQRLHLFREVCPPEFQKKIDMERISSPVAWAKADLWAGTHPGVWLWSAGTGEAKTRMLWRKFGQLHVEQGKTVLRVSGLNLAERYHDDYNHNDTDRFYNRLQGFQVVMLDDLDKIALPSTEVGFSEDGHAQRNARMLREVFDRFYEWHTPVLVTANEPIAWFAERIGPSTERRMRETCAEIAF